MFGFGLAATQRSSVAASSVRSVTLKTNAGCRRLAFWELANLARAGRVKLDRTFDDRVAHANQRLECRQAPITFEIALETRGVALSHHEPADRIIAATARVLGLTLVTADEDLLAAPNVPTMPAS